MVKLKRRIIDSHTHIGNMGKYSCTLGRLLQQMDENSISYALVSDMDAIEFDYDGNRLSSESGIRINDSLLQLVKSHRNLRQLFLIRPFSESADEKLFEYICTNRENIVGLKVQPLCAKVKFGAAEYESYFELCARLNLPFCVHTENDGFSDTILVYDAAKRNPSVTFVAVHAGMRTDHKEAFSYAAELDNFYVDTTILNVDAALDAVKSCGSGKVLFGSDAAVLDGNNYDRYAGLYEKIRGEFGETAAENVFYNNADRLFSPHF